ncbi:MAG: MarR family transcriptional regulator [Rubrivivax sp.]
MNPDAEFPEPAAGSRLLQPAGLHDLLLFRLARLQAVAGAPVIRLCEGQYGITRREWRLIVALAQEGPMLSSALAERIRLDRGRTSLAVSALVRKGLLTRQPRPHDRRRVDLAPTAAAQAIYDALYPQVVAINRALLASLSPRELGQLDGLLQRLQAAADAALAGAVLPKANRREGGTRRHGVTGT